jgi:hypothetical protein
MPNLSQTEYRQMLEEIGLAALTVGRSFLSQAPKEEGGLFEPLAITSGNDPETLSGREQVAFLAAHLPALEQAVDRIAERPRTRLQRESMAVPLERARQPQPHSVLAAVRRAGLAGHKSFDGLPPITALLNGCVPATVLETVVKETTDTPENRWLAAALSHWQKDLRSIASVADWTGEREMVAQAEALQKRLRRVSGSPFLQDVSQSVSLYGTESLLRDPRYRAIYEIERRYRRRFRYAWQAPSMLLNAREPWLLYECWCFFKVVEALWGLGWQPVGGDAVRLVHNRIAVNLAKGQSSRLHFQKDGRALSITYNRTFLSAASGSERIASCTHALIPDICLESEGRLLLLDAKFRSYANEGEEQIDIIKMHAYRDAIRKGDRPVVDAAWCLFPGETGCARVIAYPKPSQELPFGLAGIGAIKLRPGQTDHPLANLLLDWLVLG